MIAIALACDPMLLLADEPTTALDVTIQAQILDLIRSLSDEFGTAVILITHDLGIAAGMCNRINVMYAGRIVETGTVDDMFEQPADALHVGPARLAAAHRRGEGRHGCGRSRACRPTSINPGAECRFSPRCHVRPRHLPRARSPSCRRATERGPPRPLLRHRSREDGSSDRDARDAASAAGQDLVQVSDLKVHFPITARHLPARDRVACGPSTTSRFDIRKGETLGLVGESGCGKSTTGRAVIRLRDQPPARSTSTART